MHLRVKQLTNRFTFLYIPHIESRKDNGDNIRYFTRTHWILLNAIVFGEIKRVCGKAVSQC